MLSDVRSLVPALLVLTSNACGGIVEVASEDGTPSQDTADPNPSRSYNVAAQGEGCEAASTCEFDSCPTQCSPTNSFSSLGACCCCAGDRTAAESSEWFDLHVYATGLDNLE